MRGRTDVSADLLQARHGWRWGMLDRVFVFVGSPISLLLTGLLQLLLCFGICEAQTEFDTINLVGDIVEVSDD
jgi:hypothetical protein